MSPTTQLSTGFTSQKNIDWMNTQWMTQQLVS